ncbi:MAG: sigma-70 family RNA polymerase sigma factor [Pseudomonadota bacterium]
MADVDTQVIEIIEDHGMRRYVETILGAADRVDDVMQNVAERLLLNPPHARNPRGLVMSAVRNAAIDERRAAKRRRQREQDYAFAHDQPNSVEAHIDFEQIVEALDRALRELPLLTQALFYAHYVSGCPQHELSSEYGLHLSTIEKRLAKARSHCRRRLARIRP